MGEVWAGDDAAVVAMQGHSLLATDSIVEDVDFSFDYFSGADIGWKAIAVNASDVAAMGGRPVHAVASMGMRSSLPLRVFEDVLQGLLEACSVFRMDLVGGDLTKAKDTFLAVTVTGACDAPVLRSGATIGDAICVTGSLGGSNGALFALRNKVPLDSAAALAMKQRHLRPEARVAAGMALAAAGATAMIDVSDGFAIDLVRLLKASEAGCEVSSGLIPIDPGLGELSGVPGGPDALEAALSGGEDFELICTLPPATVDAASDAVAQTGVELTRVGIVAEGEMMLDGSPFAERQRLGWDHLGNL